MKLIYLCISFVISQSILAQGVGIGTTNPHSSAALEIESNSQGLLIPRTDTSNISMPAEGLLIFQTSDKNFYYHNGVTWRKIGAAVAGASVLKDTDEDTRVEVEHTVDDDIIRFYSNNVEVMRHDGKTLEQLNNGESVFIGELAGANDDLSTNSNTFVGYKAGTNNESGDGNTAVGKLALERSIDGYHNTAIGKQALFDNIGNNNTAVGVHASSWNTTGTKNVSIGNYASYRNTSGSFNTIIGSDAGYGFSNGVTNSNVLIGAAAGRSIDGDYNLAIGNNALFSVGSGTENVAIGDSALSMINGDIGNLAIGYRTGARSTGSGNTFVGTYSGYNNSSVGNAFFGYKTGYSNAGAFNSFFGHRAGMNNENSHNSFFGYRSGIENVTGKYNSYFGAFSGEKNVDGFFNTFYGYAAGNKTTSGHNAFFGAKSGSINESGQANAFFGNETGKSNVDQNNNSYFGHAAGRNATGDNTCLFGKSSGLGNSGANNSFFGNKSGFSNLSGSDNTFLGFESGYLNNVGVKNVLVGYKSGRLNNGSSNIFIGEEAGSWNDKGNRTVCIGRESGYKDTQMGNSVYIGYQAGYLFTPAQRNGNIFIGHQAGFGQDIENRLIIDNSNTGDPLIDGNFSNNSLTINGNLGVGLNDPNTKLVIFGNNSHITGPIATFKPEFGNQGESGRLRFLDSASPDTWKGSYIHYDGFTNKFHIGIHNTSSTLIHDDLEIFTIDRSTGYVGIGKDAPTGELHVHDRDGNGSVVHRLTTSTAEQIIGFNPSNEGILGMVTNHNLRIRTNNITRLEIGKSGNIGIGVVNATERLYVAGNICATGSIASCSDIRYKRSLAPISNALNNLLKIKGIYYQWKAEEFPSKKFNDRRQVGMIAQEVEQVFPEIVNTSDDSYKSIDYTKLTPILLEAIRELNDKIENINKIVEIQQTSIRTLEAQLETNTLDDNKPILSAKM